MKILVIDDHALFREGLVYVLQQLDADVQIMEASHYQEALAQLSTHSDLDLILLDLYLPGKNGFSILKTIRSEYPVMPVAIISGSSQTKDIKKSLDMGALGYIPKDTTGDVLLNAIKLILSGGVYIPQCMMNQPTKELSENSNPALTPRQIEVLEQISLGKSNKVIATLFQLSEATVKMHISAIFKSLNVTNRTQAALAAKKLDLGYVATDHEKNHGNQY